MITTDQDGSTDSIGAGHVQQMKVGSSGRRFACRGRNEPASACGGSGDSLQLRQFMARAVSLTVDMSDVTARTDDGCLSAT